MVPNPDTQLLDQIPLAGYFELIDQETVEAVFTPEIPPLFTNFPSEFTLEGDVLTLRDEVSTMFDFDEDGTPDPAIFEGTMVRS